LRWALPMQLWFLSERHRQFADVASRKRTPMIADYSPLKNDVFATLLLNGRDLRLFESLSASLIRTIRLPTTVVYLDARDDVLLDRIARRSRPYEAHIDRHYLQGVRQAYEQRLASDESHHIVKADTSELDLSSEAQMADFYHKVLTLTSA
jgi:deoxyguanosine kinase